MAREHGARQKVDQGTRGGSKSGEAGMGRGHSRPQSLSTLLAREGLGPYQASSSQRANGSGSENGKRREKNSPRTSSPHSPLEIEAQGTI